jgi:magnesium-transporting ATPase (P-type)
MNKLGQITGNVFGDIIMISGILFAVALSMLAMTHIWNQVKDNTDLFPQDNEFSKRINASGDKTMAMFAFVFVMLVSSIFVGLVVTGRFVQSSPVFFVVGFIVILIGVVIAVPISNAYEVIANDSTLSSASPRIINLLMGNLPILVLFAGVSLLLAMYSKRSQPEVGF